MSETEQRQSQLKPKKQSRKTNPLIIVLAALLVVAIIVILILCLQGGNSGTPDIPVQDDAPTVIGGGEPIPGDENTEKDSGHTHLPAFASLNFAAGTKEQAVVLTNPGENSCLIRISLILTDGTTIYQSELVKPGHYTKPITLVAPMERGIYRDVTIRYECFTDDEKQTPLNNATNTLDIIVE